MTRRVVLQPLGGMLGVVLLVTMLSAWANAACGDFKTHASIQKQSFGITALPSGTLLLAADDADPVVGMWHVTFTAEGNNPGPPDGVTIDNALVTVHSDGTEIMNSGRPAQDGQFCMG